ncbi:hypothetical protein K501DRAFT_337813 [Backusella circina FSU 941]|nr:hypothetical protein K501DRAFT_337813 [Backusella circina FSU 941]
MAPLPKRIKLMSTIEQMSRQLEGMVLELNSVTEQCRCESVVPCKHMALIPQEKNTRWNCSFTQRKGQLSFEATIHSFSELRQFLTETMQAFQSNPSSPIQPHHDHHSSKTTLPFFLQQQSNSTSNNKHIVIQLTFRNFKDQAIFFRLLKMENAPAQYADQSTFPFDDPEYISAKKRLISVYFDCLHRITPILIRSYYYPHLRDNPSSLLATSIVAAVTLSSCHHIQTLPHIKQISETARQETRMLLNETLFTSVDLDTCIALFYLGTCEIYSLCSRKAQVYSNLCWRMLQELKEHPLDEIQRETWKRLYYYAFYLEANLCNVHNVSLHDAIPRDPPFPTQMPCEKQEATSIICMHFMAKLFVTTCHNDLLWFKLTTGSLDRVSITTIHQLEHTLYQLWLDIPPELQIGNGPLEYITPLTSRAAWSNPAVLRLNQMYYTFWLTIHIRFMSLHKTTLPFADRALLIASICSDTLTKLFYYMNQHCACAIDTHWLALLNEVLRLLYTSPQPEIRQRARWNQTIMRQVMQSVLMHVPCAPFFEISHYELCTLYK